MPNLKFIFIVNDDENQAFNFIRGRKLGRKDVYFDTEKRFNDIDFGDLITYQHYYINSCHIYFENCCFGNVGNYDSSQLLLDTLSNIIESALAAKNIKGVGWVFIRVNDSDDKQYAIDLLSKRYESKSAREARQAETESSSSKQVHFMNFGHTIILNKCFIDSRYTLFADNISHEAINCFKADSNNKRYLYLCSSGILKEEYLDRTTPGDKLPIDYFDKNKIIYFDYSKTGKDEEGSAQYVFLRKAYNVKPLECAFEESLTPENYVNVDYGQQNIIDIFDDNYYSGVDDDELMEEVDTSDNAVKTYATFVAEPEDVFIPSNNDDAIVAGEDELEGLKGSTMRHFVIQGSSFYQKILEKDEKIDWEEENAPTFDQYRESEEYLSDSIPTSIMSIIDKENKEVYYSNLISYAFAKSDVILNKFLEKCEINEEVNRGAYSINRELKNIDIFVKNNKTDNKFEIVIENKIEADFNTKELKEWNKLVDENSSNADIISELEDEKEQYKTNYPTRIMDCQLSKYYFLARYIAKKNNVDPEEHVKYIIICPEQFVERYNTKKNNYSYGEKYIVVSYKLIYESIEYGLEHDNSLEENEKETISEINKCLKIHTSKTNTVFISRNRHRFAKRILSLREPD